MKIRRSAVILLCLLAGCATRTPAPTPAPAPQPADEPAIAEAPAVKPVKPAPAAPKKAQPAPPAESETATRSKPKAQATVPASKTDWQKILAQQASDAKLSLDAHYFPSLAWLSARWCKKGDRSGEAALFYNVERTPTGFLNLVYADPNGSDKRYTHVHISGRYFDLWDEFAFGEYLRNEGGRRLEKRADDEFALVYVFDEKPQRDRYDKQVFLDFTARRAAQIKPADHLADPPVYVKCVRPTG